MGGIGEEHDPNGPLVVSARDSVAWDDEADLIVVGFGGAGVAAALEARENGADVLAVERFAGGGATSFSGGILYAGGTRHQAEAGHPDTPEEMFKYLWEEGSAVSADTLRRYCDGSNADLEWLERNGVPYGSTLFKDKTSYPPDGYWLYYSGNEKSPRFAAIAKPAPRGHRPVSAGFGGTIYFDRLRESALAKGVRLLSHAPVHRLIVDADGRVIGVEARTLPQAHWPAHGRLYKMVEPWRPLNQMRAERAIQECRDLESRAGIPRRIAARSGVILSTGGFIYNQPLLGQQRPTLARNYQALLRLGSMGCDGSGIALGVSAGGATDYMDEILLGRSISPPEAYVEALLVNQEGRRFVNEDAYLSVVGDAIARQSDDGRAWLVLDRRLFRQALRQSFFPGKGMFMLYGAPALLNIAAGGTRRGRTLAALARKCGIDAEALERTVADFNAVARQGAADALGKSPAKMRAVEDGPYTAVNVSLDNKFAPTFAFTLGGLVVDEETGAVRRPDGSPIAGLYAAGRAAVGLCSKAYMSGLSIADTVFSGRRAARDATRRLNRRVDAA
jgi:3-oxo-5alpha-steroid 4-dehydrogenase